MLQQQSPNVCRVAKPRLKTKSPKGKHSEKQHKELLEIFFFEGFLK